MASYHLIGVGGIGLSAVALWLKKEGEEVSGCDARRGYTFDVMAEEGIKCFVGHDPAHLHGVEVVGVSTAISAEHEELKAAYQLGLEVLPRAALLARLANRYYQIAVTGTHGKTTTSAMISWILYRMSYPFVSAIGGVVREWGSNFYWSGKEVAVIEADESDRTLTYYRPSIAVITNVELDHPDFYSSKEEVLSEIRNFAEKSKRVVTTVDLGMKGMLLKGRDWDVVGNRLEYLGKSYELNLKVPGRHNLLNAALAIIAVSEVIPIAEAVEAISSFQGVARRLEVIGRFNEMLIYDDYAHHPTEVEAVIKTLKEKHSRVAVVFQPHRYSRLEKFIDQFAQALKMADEVAVLPVYSAGEKKGSITSEDLANQLGRKVIDKYEVKDYLNKLRGFEAVAFLGAGDITKIAHKIAG